ncbi:MAG: hypothetical protein JJT96_12770 [Opitutales bacterium]|nr:hypothetical protein [Opitutales bacterium]
MLHLRGSPNLMIGYASVAMGLALGAVLLQVHFYRNDHFLTVEVARIVIPAGVLLSFLAAFYFTQHVREAALVMGKEVQIFQFVALLLAGSFLVRIIDLPWLPTLREEADVFIAADRIRAHSAIASEESAQRPKAKTRSQEISQLSFPLRFRISCHERVSEGTFLLGSKLELPLREGALRKGDHVRHYIAVINPDQLLRQEWQRQLDLLAAGMLSAAAGIRRSRDSSNQSGENALKAIKHVNTFIDQSSGLRIEDQSALSECRERLHQSVSQLSRVLEMADLQSGTLEINRFLDWSRQFSDNRSIPALVNEDGNFHAAFEAARNYETLLRELPEGALRVSLDREGYWKVVVFSQINGTWRATARGFRVLRPIMLPAASLESPSSCSQAEDFSRPPAAEGNSRTTHVNQPINHC